VNEKMPMLLEASLVKLPVLQSVIFKWSSSSSFDPRWGWQLEANTLFWSQLLHFLL